MFHVKHATIEAATQLCQGFASIQAMLSPDKLAELATWIAVAGRSAGLTHYADPCALLAQAIAPAVPIATALTAANATNIAEVGPGSGALGLALALAMPDCAFSFVDAAAKSTIFIQTTARRCGIPNAKAVQARLPVPNLSTIGGPFDAAFFRALARGPLALTLAGSIIAENGQILALHRDADPAFLVPQAPFRLLTTAPSGVPGLSLSQYIAESAQ